jgi:hypothetical protein
MNPKYFFDKISLWIRSRAIIWVVFEADYEIKLLVIVSEKKGDNTDILKLQKSFIWLFFSTIYENGRAINFPKLLNKCMEKPYCAHLLSSKYNHQFYDKVSRTSQFIPQTRRQSLSWGNHHQSSRIVFVNLAIFWHCGLLWFTLQPRKSHTCSIGFLSGAIAGHQNVSIASCCLNSYNGIITLSAIGWGMCALSTLWRYAMPLRLLCKTRKSNLQLKEKHLQTVSPNAVVPITFPSWNAVVLCRQTRTWSSMGCNKNRLLSDQWIHFQLRIFQRRWWRDEFHRARQWHNDI